MRGIPPLCTSSRKSDSWWRNLSTEQLGDVRDVRSVLGVALVEPILLRVLAEGRVQEEDEVLVVKER